MIPKVIHYCWFGGAPLPKLAEKCMASWREKCPDYQIVAWNENNFDVRCNRYCQEAYEAKQWAFVSDYARLKIVYDHGGIYLDTDVELLRDLTPLIEEKYGFVGFENCWQVNTGLGFGAQKGSQCIGKMLDVYGQRRFFLSKDKYNLLPCPTANTIPLQSLGLEVGKAASMSVQQVGDLLVYPTRYFNPKLRDTGNIYISEDTYSIHHYSSLWLPKSNKLLLKVKSYIPKMIRDMWLEFVIEKNTNRFKKEMSLQVDDN